MGDNENVTALPDQLFINHINTTNLHNEVLKFQKSNASEISDIANTHTLEQIHQHWYKDGRLLVVGPNELKRGVTKLYHDTIAAGHPGISNTLFSISRDYWWPRMKQWVTEYIKGCAMCQANKSNTHHNRPAIFPIAPKEEALLTCSNKAQCEAHQRGDLFT